MPVTMTMYNALVAALGEEDAARLADSAARAERVERRWVNRLDQTWEKIKAGTIQDLERTGRVSEKTLDMFTDFYVEHAFNVMLEAIRSTRSMPRLPSGRRLARYPVGPMPRTLPELRKLWDLWRKKGQAPKRQAAIAEKVKAAYIKKAQATWRDLSEQYRKGKEPDKAAVIRELEAVADTNYARAKTIVETETTRYWNRTRKAIYSENDDITHFLFVPVRDHATTKWCKSRRGLVYAKGDPLLDKETPPIHWNCRSELLPLTIMNPRHLILIQDKSRERRRHSCEPLPAGWNAA